MTISLTTSKRKLTNKNGKTSVILQVENLYEIVTALDALNNGKSNALTVETGVTAFATGGQASATAITKTFTVVSTCATDGDSVKLPAAIVTSSTQEAQVYAIKNNGANILAVFPATGDTINAGSANASVNVYPGETVVFRNLNATDWQTDNVALGYSGIRYSKGTPQTRTGAGAINLTTDTTLLVTTAADALTLADGREGQYKTIIMKTDGGDGTLTPTTARGFTTVTFSAVGQTVTLQFLDGAWNVISSFGAVVA